VVIYFFYAAPTLNFCDQFAFRPTGSTTASYIIKLYRATHTLYMHSARCMQSP